MPNENENESEKRIESPTPTRQIPDHKFDSAKPKNDLAWKPRKPLRWLGQNIKQQEAHAKRDKAGAERNAAGKAKTAALPPLAGEGDGGGLSSLPSQAAGRVEGSAH